MRGFSRTAAGVCLALVAPVILGASSIDLTTIEFPERQTVEFDLLPQSGAPDAKVNGKVTFREGLAQIDVNYASMKPAILYGGDVTAYVVWAIARDGSAENLGELVAATPKGNRSFSSAKKRFALIVTAEPYYLVSRPSGLVSFINGLPKKKNVTSEGFTFAGLIEAPDHAMESIRDISWESKEPLALLQARKAYELAGRYGAPDYTKQIYAEAKEALDQANEFQTKGNNNKKLLEYAGQSVELSNEAINITRQRVEREAIEALMDARRAEMMAMETSIASLATQREELEVTVAALDRRTAAAEQEADDLNAMLSYALSQVADARATAAGYVVSLPDILFDVDKATLKPEAQRPLAKLSGILLVMRGLGVTVSGYTDATGSAEHNLGLSEQRARAVMDFFASEGVSAKRISAVGYGIENPIATNDTPEGRRQNRRVEILLAEAK